MNYILQSLWIFALATTVLLLSFFRSSKDRRYLRFIGVSVIWGSYFLGPLLALFDGFYEKFALVEEFLPQVFIYAFLCMLAFYGGVEWYISRSNKKRKISVVRQMRFPSEFREVFERYYVQLTYGMIFLLIVVFIYTIGGVGELWVSSHARGAGQWAERTLLVRISRTMQVLKGLLGMLCCLFGAIVFMKYKRMRFRLPAFFSMLVGSLPSMHGLSRGSGVAFFFLALVGFWQSGRKFILKGILLLLITFFFAQTALYARSLYYPGIYSYIKGAVGLLMNQSGADNIVDSDEEDFSFAQLNFMDEAATASQVFYARDDERMSLPAALIGFVTQINPFPAEFIPLRPFGLSSLSVRMGTEGSSGFPVPSLAQTYSALGFWGALLWCGLGFLCGLIDNHYLRSGSVLGFLAVFMAVAGLVNGIQAPIRSLIRPFHVALVLIWVEIVGERVRMKKYWRAIKRGKWEIL